MRNPFARLAKRDIARPSLRERAASLKASAARVIRRKPMDVSPVSVPAADPIFVVIDTTRGLTIARTNALAMDLPPGTIDPTPEQNAATDAFFAHVDGVLLKTVPTTAAGCTAFARYAVEFLADEGFVLDEQGSEHVRILELIARSPLLDGAPPARAPAPDFSGYAVNDLRRTYDAFRLATDVMGLTGWTISSDGAGNHLLNDEADRLSHFQSYIADELRRRSPTDRDEAIARADTLISHDVAGGAYDCVAATAAEAEARRLY